MSQAIRNFCIIAHIDHGKSTLADRMLDVTGTLDHSDKGKDQVLDLMDIEQERGITIKLTPVRMEWKGVQMNLIDTPGHVDFTYEVSRSLAACEGAILVVDATQGIEAQTLANVYLAMEHDLEIIAVVNKIDLPAAEPEKRAEEIEKTFGIPAEEVLMCSAKSGIGIEPILDTVIEKIPDASEGQLARGERDDVVVADVGDGARALIFDSFYDNYLGVVAYIRMVDGEINHGDKLHMLRSGANGEVVEMGTFRPGRVKGKLLKAGEVGYLATSQKNVRDARVGDTITNVTKHYPQPLAGYHEPTPMVYAGIFCVDNSDYPHLRDALEKVALNDAALSYVPENSPALGFGFRVGFLGLLHMEILQERLEREFDMDMIITSPSVPYTMLMKDGTEKMIAAPSEVPDRTLYEDLLEPWVKLEVVAPHDYVGSVMTLVDDRRGAYQSTDYVDETRALIHFEIPLSSIVSEFYDALKSVTSGYASMSYSPLDYRTGDLAKIDLLVAGDPIGPLSFICPRSEAHSKSTKVLEVLKKVIPRENFVIALQAAIGGKILARENISAFRKDVTAGMYGGDFSRKKKKLEKQKAGKKRMKQFGRVTIPQDAFLSILKK